MQGPCPLVERIHLGPVGGHSPQPGFQAGFRDPVKLIFE